MHYSATWKDYFIILLYYQIIGSLILALILIAVLFLVSKQGSRTFTKAIPFECGFVPNGDSRRPFSIQFFLIALVFLVFDVELILMFPMLVRNLNILSVRAGGFRLFLLIIAGGLIWEWSQGSLEWLN